MTRLEAEAQAKAAKHVANMLARPDQLEKVAQLTWRVSRKKASVEAMLKTAMQSQVTYIIHILYGSCHSGIYNVWNFQLDGVRTGLNQLEKALQDMSEIKVGMSQMEEVLAGVPKYWDSLREIREENLRHSQLATAKENLR